MAVLWNLVNPSNLDVLGQFQRGADLAQKQQITMARQSTLANLANGGIDPSKAVTALAAAGDLQGAQAIGTLYGQQEDRKFRQDTSARDFAFRQQESERAQKNADRSFGIQSAQLGLQQQQAARPDIQLIEDANGNKVPVAIYRTPGNVHAENLAVPGGAATTTPNNPFAIGGKLTGDQAKAATWADRMAASDKVITGLEGINQGLGGYVGGMAASEPMVRDSALGNAMMSSDRQKVVQAQRDFVNAILRRESGAAISQGEFENAQRQYFPQPGDSQQVLAQKRSNRKIAIEGLMREAGRGYKPPADYRGLPKNGAAQNDPLGIR